MAKSPISTKEVSEKQVARLHKLIGASESRLGAFRQRRVEAMTQLVGRHYGSRMDKHAKREPMNMIYSAAAAYIPQLVTRHAAYRVRAPHNPDLKHPATQIETAVNRTIREMDVRRTMRQIVFDSVFGWGLWKTGVCMGAVQAAEGELHDPGQTFVDRVDPDDYIIDPAARQREEARVEGNKFRIPLSEAVEAFDNTDGLQATYQAYGGGSDTSEKAEALAVSERGPAINELEDYVELRHVIMRDEGILVVLPKEGEGVRPLEITEYNGPEMGPYGMLGYMFLSDNVIPLPPVALWMDLHEMINALMRKMRRQADRAKSVLAYEDRGADDAARIVSSNDGDTARVQNIDALKQLEFGGIAPFSEGLTQWLIGMFSRQSGNTDLIGGMASDSRTATEAAFVQGNASVRIGDMQAQVHDMASDIGRSIMWYEIFDNPDLQMQLSQHIKGAELDVPFKLTPDGLIGEFLDYEIEVVPYSMKPRDPDEYAKTVLQWFTAVVLPTMEIGLAQGAVPNVPAFVKLLGEEMGIKNTDELYTVGPPQQAGGGEGGGGPQVNPGQQQATGQRAPGQGMSRGEYYVDQVFGAAQQQAPKPQSATPFKRVGV